MKLPKVILMILYLATVAFGIFLTGFFRIPAPLLFCVPLVFFWKELNSTFLYAREVVLLCFSVFLYDGVGLLSFNTAFATMTSIVLCALYFSYFVGDNKRRLNSSVWIFYGLLLLSAMVMVANHYIPQVDNLRSMVIGEPVKQSPAGISDTQFGYGYQVAAFVSFALISTFAFKRGLVLKMLVFMLCMVIVFLGMQRSAFIGFALTGVVFLLLYYRFKAVLLLVSMIGICLAIYFVAGKDELQKTDNILTKNEHNDESSNRSDLAMENLRIYAEYPYGLIFYGKDWTDVIYRNYVFSRGITSHNAYLMFITYLGPFLGLGLLVAIYFPVLNIIWHTLRNIRAPGQSMLLCMIFSFISVSINALSHNAWLFSADGPTLFSFFSVMHCYRLQQEARVTEQHEEEEWLKDLNYA